MQPSLMTLNLSRRALAALAMVLALVVAPQLVHEAAAGFSMSREKQPSNYTSPSGEYALHVNPGDRSGAGPGNYRLTRRGKEVWSGRRDFTLWDARVTDDGTVAGYSYGAGYEGWAHKGNDFRAVILDGRGQARLNASELRKSSRFLHQPNSPTASGMFIDEHGDRFVIRVDHPDINRGVEEWRTYRLSTGKPVGRYQPRQAYPARERGLWILAAEPIRGTPLTLINWWDFNASVVSAKFSLVDPETKPVWNLDLPRDYQVSGEAGEALQAEIRQHGAILDVQMPRSFEIRFAAASQRVRFDVAPEWGRRWKVTETSRKAYRSESDTKSPEAAIPTKELKLLQKFELRSPQSPAGPIQSVRALMAAGPGRLAIVRDAPGGASLCVVDYQGKVLHTVSLQQAWVQEERTRSHIAWAGGARFYVVRSVYAEDAKTTAWIVDAAAGALTELPKLGCPHVKAIAALQGGGFVLLINHVQRYTSTPGVFAFDGEGRLLWKNYDPRGYSNSDPPGRLLSPKAIAVTSRNEVAVLDNIRHTVQFFSAAGAHLRTWQLEKLWGRKPNYPTNLAAAPDGGILVYDFNAPIAVVAMDERGKILRQFKPRFAEKRPIEPTDGVICDDAGRVWATDDHAQLRLDHTGTVVQVLGSPPTTTVLTTIKAVTMGPDGRFYAVDGRTHAVHRFSSDGKWQTVFRPLPTDFDGLTLRADVTVARNGDVYLSGANGGDLRFSSSGRRLGIQAHQEPGTRKAAVSTAARWRGHSLLDARGREITRVQRRADGVWLDRMAETCTAPDGSLAVLDSLLRKGEKGAPGVTLFAPDGKVRRTFVLPQAMRQSYHIAYDGSRVAVSNGPTVMLFASNGQPQFTVTPASKSGKEAWWVPFLSGSGKYLSLFDGERTIYRYALP